jgi:hypothetical protein
MRRSADKNQQVSYQFADEVSHALPGRAKEIVRMMVEGYHAAPVDRMSAQVLAAGDEGIGEAAHRQYRIVGGYDGLLGWLRAGLDPARVSVRLRALTV